MDHPIASARNAPWYSHAWKVVVAVISTGTALISVISFIARYGVIGKPESHETIGNIGAVRVVLRPAGDTATSIDDTIHLAATITDKYGSILVGTRPTWTTDNPGVATVLKDGTVIARGPGTTTITVAVSDLLARSRIVVRQRVASVRLNTESSDGAITVPEGDHRRLQAVPLDARGHPISGLAAQWHIEDTTVAELDASGTLSGHNVGRSIVSVTIEGVAQHSAAVVVSTAAAITQVAGASQHAIAGTVLPQTFVVRVTSRRGRPVEGATVRFHVAEGRVGSDSAVTDVDGRARTVWTLGDLPGRQTLLATVERVDSALAIVAEADPVAANTRVAALQDHMSGAAGQPIDEPVAVRLTDSTGRALADVPVTWTALDGGSAEPVASRTDSLGEIRARWSLGPKSGTQHLSAQVGAGNGGRGIRPLILRAAAVAGTPTRVVIVSGDAQHGAAGSPLPKPILLRIADAAGNGVGDAALVVSPSGGSMRDSSLQTDAAGVATLRWTMGRSTGDYFLAVRVDGIKKPLKLKARAVPASPANLTFDDSPAPSTEKRAHGSGKHLVAMVTDEYGNGVPNRQVRFATKSGSARPARGVSDARGRLAVSWAMGSKKGEQSLAGRVPGTDVTGTYVAEVGGGDARANGKAISAKPVAKRSDRKHS